MCQKAYLNSPAGRVSSGHTMKPKKMMMPTAIHVGFLTLATLCISSSSSTAEASSAPAFFTFTADGTHPASTTCVAPPSGYLCIVQNSLRKQCQSRYLLMPLAQHPSYIRASCQLLVERRLCPKYFAGSWLCDSLQTLVQD